MTTTKSILMMLAAMTVPTLTAQDAKQIADNLTVPTELEGGSKLVLPTADGAKVELLGATIRLCNLFLVNLSAVKLLGLNLKRRQTVLLTYF